MKPVPLITSILVVVFLFVVVFQRDTLRSFVGLEPQGVAIAEDEVVEDEGTPPPAARVGPGGSAHVVSVIAMPSSAREIDSAVVVRGRTEADRSVNLAAQTSGQVISEAIRKGASVSEGDALCELDPGTRAASLAQAEAALNEAEVNLSNAQRLSEGGYRSETSVISARSAVESARAAVAAAEKEIENLTIRAPFSGLLESDTAEYGSLLTTGGVCATIVNLDPIKLVGFVSEVDVDRVEVGAQAGARLASGREIMGQVTFVSRAADDTTRTFRVEAEVANPDLAIRDGQTAEILIRADGTLAHLLPQSALTLNDDGLLGIRAADVSAGTAMAGEPVPGYARFMPVTMLRDTVDGVWVGGLPEEVAVITTGQDYVADGVQILVTFQESGT